MNTTTRNPNISLSILLCAVTLHVLTLAGFAQTTSQVLSLDGSGDYVSISSAPDLQNPTEITVEAWIYPSNTASGYFIMKGDAGFVDSARSYELSWQPGTGTNNLIFSVFLGDNTWGAVGAAAPANHWVHVAGTYSSTDSVLRLYTNGVLAAETTTDATGNTPLNHQLLRQTTLPLVFGGELTHPMGFAAGLMDEARIWSKARTQAEIAGTMSCWLSGSEAQLAGYWNFDAGTAADLTGHGHDGSLTGGARIQPLAGEDLIHSGCPPPSTNRVLSLNGSGDCATVTNTADLSLSSGDFSIMAWVFPKDYDTYNSAILAKRVGGSRYGWILTVGGKNREPEARMKAQFQISSGADALVRSSADIRTNEWHHIAVVYHASSAVADLYVNGFLNASASVPPPFPYAPLSNLYFGRDSTTNQYFWNGEIDEVSIWNKAISSSEIFSKMGCIRSGAEPGLVAYWNFDDGAVTDLTGYGHDATLFGAAHIVLMSGADVIHTGCGRAYFTGMNLTSDGLPFLTLIGGSEMVYRIDVSSNLIDWVPWVTLPNQYGTLQVIDPDAPGHPRRFYRALKR